MRVVITGASGLIGTNLGLRLLDEGHEVFGVDKDPNPWTDAVPVTIEDLSRERGPVGGHLGPGGRGGAPRGAGQGTRVRLSTPTTP